MAYNQESVGAAQVSLDLRMEGHSLHPINDARSSTHRALPLLSDSDQSKKSLSLIHAARKGDWKRARDSVGNESNLWRAKITEAGDNILMIASEACQWQFVLKLVELLPPEALEMQNDMGNTALHCVAVSGSVKTAKALVVKNSSLPQITNKEEATPLLLSVRSPRNKEMVRYLTLVTRDQLPSPFTGPKSVELVFALTASGYNVFPPQTDVTLRLLRRYPHLTSAVIGGANLLELLSLCPSAFHSGSKLTFWERLIYKFVHIPKTEYANTGDLGEMDTAIASSRSFIAQVAGVEQIREAKLQHLCAVEVVNYVCMNSQQARLHLPYCALYAATSLGIVEVVSSCLQHFPELIWCPIARNGGNILHVAVACRQHKIFNLINGMQTVSRALANHLVESRNSIWHLAAMLAPPTQLLSVSGAALQMQREVQWFKEVEKLVPPFCKNLRNTSGKTAQEVFWEQHSILADKGEKWMKDTANSCMIASILIATVAFAAVFTVPGGNINDKGIPIFLWKNLFLVFAISDALALFSSSTSLLMFLAILTARYEPEDFLLALPRRLIIGLGSLFISIITMMVAFGATLFLVLKDRWQWISIPIILLASIPVTTFAMLQLPLFMQMIKSTNGSSIFVKSNY